LLVVHKVHLPPTVFIKRLPQLFGHSNTTKEIVLQNKFIATPTLYISDNDKMDVFMGLLLEDIFNKQARSYRDDAKFDQKVSHVNFIVCQNDLVQLLGRYFLLLS